MTDFIVRAVYSDLEDLLGEWQDVYCSAWMIYTKFIINLYNCSMLAVALFRYFTIKYPIEYHNRSVLLNSKYLAQM